MKLKYFLFILLISISIKGQYFKVYPNAGSVAGGTRVILKSEVGQIFEEDVKVKFTVDSNCTYGSYAKIIYNDSELIILETPPFYEVNAGIFIDNPKIPDLCKPKSYMYFALGYTSNQLSSDMSVINTRYNKLFDTNPSTPEIDGIDLSCYNAIPLGSAMTNYGAEGRYIGQIDGYNGDLLWIDASNFEVLETIKLQ